MDYVGPVVGNFIVSFPDDVRLPPNYRNNTVVVDLGHDRRLRVDEDVLGGFAFDYAADCFYRGARIIINGTTGQLPQ
jgi:hypothetical protein